jgi:fibronectin-binding autotransporter adhesin
VLDLAGFNQQVVAVVIAGGTDIVTNSSVASSSTLTYNGTSPSTFGNTIVDNFANGGGKLALTVAGNTLTLSGTNTYNGNTTISGGTLALSGSGSIANSPIIAIAGGATFDVSALSSAFTLGNSQTLTGSGMVNGSVTSISNSTIAPGGPSTAGTLTVTNGVTLAGTTLMVVNSVGSSSQLVATNITYGGTLTLNNVGPGYAAGNSFTLFSAVGYSGAFTNISPTTPGAGLVWNTNALNTGGALSVMSSGPGTFTNQTGITSFSLNGADVVITGTNGQAGDAYYLLESTNVALPLSQWVPVATNVLGASGNYIFNGTNVATPGGQYQFYILGNTNK